ncbi:MAG: FtsW/RodA/SpoVE family cell cycle protein [Clostridiales bacterium]|nr:FtsW/RodA/SpoVE family cell cycle protein [Clostridiales bacterium]
MRKAKSFKWLLLLLLVTTFQVISFAQIILKDDEILMKNFYVAAGYILFEWVFLIVMRKVTGTAHLELETIAFFLSGISIAISGSISESYAVKQVFAVAAGACVYAFFLWFLRDTKRAMFMRTPVAAAAVGLLGLNLVLAKTVNGALNWINVGPISIQPSELVKIAFIFVGAATLDKLQTMHSITKYVIFSIVCVGMLFLMRDFGTALIFFVTFIIIAFMRSGDLRTIAMVCTGALLGAMLIIYFKPYVAKRFAAYRHVWELMNDKGYQQTRVMIYSASGGLFGLGIGKGKLREVFAASTDLVFGILCEEFGLITAFAVILCFAFVAFYAVKNAKRSKSAFYAILSAASAGMLLFQLSLNVFGVMDLLPLTGVTLPFISRGGTSMICVWALFSFIKSAGYEGRWANE